MPRSELDERFRKIDALVAEVNVLAPASASFSLTQMRADLAGLLVVAIAATYESCVKDVLCAYASTRHFDFGGYTARNYERLNSRIRVNDLAKYCSLFDPIRKKEFNETLKTVRQRISEKTGKNIETSYDQMLGNV